MRRRAPLDRSRGRGPRLRVTVKMQLSDGLLEHIVASLDARASAGPTPVAVEAGQVTESRRREPRVGVAARITLIPITESLPAAPFTVPLRDLSAGGLGFLHTDRLGLDEQFVALLPDGRDAMAVLCRVAYYQPLGERLYAVGATFVRVLRQSAAAEQAAALPLSRRQPADARRLAS